MLPTSRDVHIDGLLTNIAIAYSNQKYIADQIFPIVPVNKQSDLFPTYDQSHWFRDEARVRAPATKSEGGGWTVGTDNYFALRYSYRSEIPDEVRDNADAPFALESNATNFVMDKIAMRREVAWANDFFTTGVWGNDDAGSTDFTQWSDYSASLPFVDLLNYQDEIEARIGVEGNTIVMGKQVWNKLKWHPDMVDTIKYTERGIPSEELFKAATGFTNVLVGRAIMTTDPEGTAEASVTYTRIFGKHALVMYVPPSPSLMTPAAGYTFTWRRVPNSINYVVRHRDDEREVDIIEGNTYFDQKVTAARAGTFLQNAVA